MMNAAWLIAFSAAASFAGLGLSDSSSIAAFSELDAFASENS